MKLNSSIKYIITAVSIFTCSVSIADENGESLIYIGGGAAKGGSDTESDKAPLSIGYLRISNASNTVIGFDISREGTLLDSTWGQDRAVISATSLNFLIGRNLLKSEKSRFDAAFLIGGRQKTTECPSSNLGFQCYADSSPETSYAFNYGGVFTVSYGGFFVGLRATGESAQALLGARF